MSRDINNSAAVIDDNYLNSRLNSGAGDNGGNQDGATVGDI